VTSPNGLGTPGGARAAGQPASPALPGGRRLSQDAFAAAALDHRGPDDASDPFSLRHRVLLGCIATATVATFAQIFENSDGGCSPGRSR
jgi:hypothetical protein